MRSGRSRRRRGGQKEFKKILFCPTVLTTEIDIRHPSPAGHFRQRKLGDAWNNNSLSDSRASRWASFSATTAIRWVMERSTGSALRHKQKGRRSRGGGMVGRSTTRTLFSPGPKRESATSHGALPATARAPLNGPQ